MELHQQKMVVADHISPHLSLILDGSPSPVVTKYKDAAGKCSAIFDRIAVCWNAMVGIDDPEECVRVYKAVQAAKNTPRCNACNALTMPEGNCSRVGCCNSE